MSKIEVIFNSPKPKLITVKYGKEKVSLTLKEYEQLIPDLRVKVSEEDFFKNLRKNIKNYFVSLK